MGPARHRPPVPLLVLRLALIYNDSSQVLRIRCILDQQCIVQISAAELPPPLAPSQEWTVRAGALRYRIASGGKGERVTHRLSSLF